VTKKTDCTTQDINPVGHLKILGRREERDKTAIESGRRQLDVSLEESVGVKKRGRTWAYHEVSVWDLGEEDARRTGKRGGERGSLEVATRVRPSLY